jgi:hypothetical protein
MDVPLNIAGNYKDKHIQNKHFELFSQFDFTQEGNTNFNDYMDSEEKDLQEMKLMIDLLEKEEQEPRKTDFSKMVPDDAENYGAQEVEDFWTEHNWYYECDICWENTRNRDCKCLGAVQKVDTMEFRTLLSKNLTTGEDKNTLVPHVVKKVPILFYV